MKKVLGILAVVALLVAPAMAVVDPPQNVPVTINVAQNVAMWSNDASIALTLNGGMQNGDAVAGSLSRIHNVDAKLTVQVTGTLPTPSVPGGGVNFFIFSAGNAATIKAQMANDTLPGGSYNPTGALVWTKAIIEGANPALPFGGTLTKTASILSVPAIYAANAPGDMPDPQAINLVVTWTIAPA